MLIVRLTLAALLCLSFRVCAAQSIFWDQPWDGVSQGRSSWKIVDGDTQSIYQIDNFSVNGIGYLLTHVFAYGRESAGSDPSQTVSYKLRIMTAPDLRSGAAVFAEYSYTPAQCYSGGNLVMSTNTFLVPGAYYISIWAERPAAALAWEWLSTTPVRGGEALVQNPGGGLGFGPAAVVGSQVYGSPRDMAFSLEQAMVPEAGTLLMILPGLSIIFLRRRK